MTETEKELSAALVEALMLGQQDDFCDTLLRSPSAELRHRADKLDALEAQKQRLWEVARKYTRVERIA